MIRRDTTELLAAILRAIDAHLRAGATERARHVDALADTLAVVLMARGMTELDAHRAVRKALDAACVSGTREYGWQKPAGAALFAHWSAMTDDEDAAAIAERDAKRAAEWAA